MSNDKTPQQAIEEIFNAKLCELSPSMRDCKHIEPGQKAKLPWKQYGGYVALTDTKERLEDTARQMARQLEDELYGRSESPTGMTPEYRDGLTCFAPKRPDIGDKPHQVIFEVTATYHDVARGTLFFVGAQFSKI